MTLYNGNGNPKQFSSDLFFIRVVFYIVRRFNVVFAIFFSFHRDFPPLSRDRVDWHALGRISRGWPTAASAGSIDATKTKTQGETWVVSVWFSIFQFHVKERIKLVFYTLSDAPTCIYVVSGNAEKKV